MAPNASRSLFLPTIAKHWWLGLSQGMLVVSGLVWTPGAHGQATSNPPPTQPVPQTNTMPAQGNVARLKFDDSAAPANLAAGSATAPRGQANQVSSVMPTRDTNTASIKLDAMSSLPPGPPPSQVSAAEEFVRIGYWQSGGVGRRTGTDQRPEGTLAATSATNDPNFNGPDAAPGTETQQQEPANLAVPARDSATSLPNGKPNTKIFLKGTGERVTPVGTAAVESLPESQASNDQTPSPSGSTAPNDTAGTARMLLSDESIRRMPRSNQSVQMGDQAPPPPPAGTSLTEPRFNFMGASYFKQGSANQETAPGTLPVDPRWSGAAPRQDSAAALSSDSGGATGWNPEVNSQASSVGCSPLFYSTLWVGQSELQTLRDDRWDPAVTNGVFEMSRGVSAGLGLGVYHGNNLRGEFELAARSNNLDSFDVTRPLGLPGQQSFPLDGELRTYSGMSNLYWDFGRKSNRRFRPYVGAGVGFAFQDADFDNFGRSVMVPNFDRDSSFAYQWMAGVNAVVTRELELFVEYRHFATDGLRLGTQFSRFGAQVGDPDQIFGDYDYRSQNVLMGLRIKF